MTGLEKITERILSDARAQAEATLAEARRQCEQIAAQYDSRAEKIRTDVIAQAEREGESIITRAKSAASMEKRNILLEARSRMVDEAFGQARRELLGMDHAATCELLSGLLANALQEQLETEKTNRALYGDQDVETVEHYDVLFNEKDRKEYAADVLAGVRRIVVGKLDAGVLEKLRISEQTAPIDGGLILRFGDVESNCSFAMLLGQLRGELEAQVCDALFH